MRTRERKWEAVKDERRDIERDNNDDGDNDNDNDDYDDDDYARIKI